jgi:hypothetical protein
MPFILPKGAEREYLTVNGIVAVYIAELRDGEFALGVSHDLYQSLVAIRRQQYRYAAIVGAYWVKSDAEAALLCDEALAGGHSKPTRAMVANRIEAAAERLNIAVIEHQALLTRVREAVEYVESKLAEAQGNGQLQFFNRAYRQWRLQAKAYGRSMTYAEARARLRRSLYRQLAEGEPIEISFPALQSLTA